MPELIRVEESLLTFFAKFFLLINFNPFCKRTLEADTPCMSISDYFLLGSLHSAVPCNL